MALGKHLVAMPRTKEETVFLNIPYDPQFTRLYFAYIASVSAVGLLPRATLGIAGNRRLERIASLLESCAYSIHDLSRVQLDRNAPSTPRFNMPFELGLAVARSQANPRHKWFVFEAVRRRLNKSLSDLDGTDPYIHGETVSGVMREVCNAFVSPVKQPTVPQMMAIYRGLRRDSRRVLKNAGAHSVFTARVFSDLCLGAASLRKKYVGSD
jgi:hypothetical protein